MYIYMTFAILPLVAHIVSCESTNATTKDVKQAKTTLKTQIVQATIPAEATISSNRATLWDKTPPLRMNSQPDVRDEKLRRSYELLLNAPHSLTKLAKTLSLGFDPSFSKDYFEPFERRPRPVTLVAFRKKGYAVRNVVKMYSGSNEVAEQQSPFNEVSNFWQYAEREA